MHSKNSLCVIHLLGRIDIAELDFIYPAAHILLGLFTLIALKVIAVKPGLYRIVLPLFLRNASFLILFSLLPFCLNPFLFNPLFLCRPCLRTFLILLGNDGFSLFPQGGSSLALRLFQFILRDGLPLLGIVVTLLVFLLDSDSFLLLVGSMHELVSLGVIAGIINKLRVSSFKRFVRSIHFSVALLQGFGCLGGIALGIVRFSLGCIDGIQSTVSDELLFHFSDTIIMHRLRSSLCDGIAFHILKCSLLDDPGLCSLISFLVGGRLHSLIDRALLSCQRSVLQPKLHDIAVRASEHRTDQQALRLTGNVGMLAIYIPQVHGGSVAFFPLFLTNTAKDTSHRFRLCSPVMACGRGEHLLFHNRALVPVLPLHRAGISKVPDVAGNILGSLLCTGILERPSPLRRNAALPVVLRAGGCLFRFELTDAFLKRREGIIVDFAGFVGVVLGCCPLFCILQTNVTNPDIIPQLLKVSRLCIISFITACSILNDICTGRNIADQRCMQNAHQFILTSCCVGFIIPHPIGFHVRFNAVRMIRELTHDSLICQVFNCFIDRFAESFIYSGTSCPIDNEILDGFRIEIGTEKPCVFDVFQRNCFCCGFGYCCNTANKPGLCIRSISALYICSSVTGSADAHRESTKKFLRRFSQFIESRNEVPENASHHDAVATVRGDFIPDIGNLVGKAPRLPLFVNRLAGGFSGCRREIVKRQQGAVRIQFLS